ncbi:serpin (serine protease inhibitor) domain-containing protein [Phthorimaea operculella]|nr:serpin (serine protease inhibitor) domain-containing protein [Phthorimaea operculella]
MIKFAVIAFVCIASVNCQCFYKDDSSKKLDPEARTSLYKGQLEFTLNLFNAINKAVPDDNIFFSPFSVYHSLLLAYFSTAGQTEQSLKRSLQIAENLDKINLMTAYKVDRRSRATNNNSESYEFNSANKLFVSKELDVRQCVQELFGEELEALNFKEDPQAAVEYINKWVSRITKNNINDLLPSDGVSENTKLVLANAAYFKGVWASKFPKEMTKKQAFFVSETRQTLVPFMKQKGSFHYMVSDELGAQILELPYKGNDISMYILLPPYSMKEGVTNIIANLTPERLAAVVEESYMGREVVVEIPKFTMERSLPLRDILETLGVGDLFNSSADFSTLTPQSGILFDDAVHKAKIQVDEEGAADLFNSSADFSTLTPQSGVLFDDAVHKANIQVDEEGALETLGAGNLFNSSADFSTLTPQSGILFDDAVHKAKIQVDEEGVGDLFNSSADFSTLTPQSGILFDDAVHKAKIQVDEEGALFMLETLLGVGDLFALDAVHKAKIQVDEEDILGVGDLFNSSTDFSTLTPQSGVLFDDAVHKAKIQVDEEGAYYIPHSRSRRFVMLDTLGVGDLFNSSADFSTLTPQSGVLFDDAVHKAKIQVDEEGAGDLFMLDTLGAGDLFMLDTLGAADLFMLDTLGVGDLFNSSADFSTLTPQSGVLFDDAVHKTKIQVDEEGAADLFNSSADFSTLTPQSGVLFDDAVHKAKIQVDEKGTTASAATAIFGFRSSRPAEPTYFKANFPFVYVLYERPTSSILFMGVYRDPKK